MSGYTLNVCSGRGQGRWPAGQIGLGADEPLHCGCRGGKASWIRRHGDGDVADVALGDERLLGSGEVGQGVGRGQHRLDLAPLDMAHEVGKHPGRGEVRRAPRPRAGCRASPETSPPTASAHFTTMGRAIHRSTGPARVPSVVGVEPLDQRPGAPLRGDAGGDSWHARRRLHGQGHGTPYGPPRA